MIHLTSPGGSEILVNPYHVFAVEKLGKGTRILSSNGVAIVVAEGLEEVNRAFKRWARAGDE